MNEAYDYFYDNQNYLYGKYTKLSENKNGRSHYQSDFAGGKYGIWWCGNSWSISLSSNLGQCDGYVTTTEDEECVENVGWNWLWNDGQGKAWHEAGEGLAVKCSSFGAPFDATTTTTAG